MDRFELPRNPRAETYKVEELVADALRGRLRVPAFQRPLRWDAKDVVVLFDSILRGYPIGSLLLWRRPGPAPDVPVQLGPIVVESPEREDVRWLVDGQQRVTALVAALDEGRPADPTYDVWFDPDVRTFHSRPRGAPERTWVRLPILLDAAALGEFLLEWGPGLEVRERRRVLLEAGKRIREYPVPAYVIEAEDDAALREIFRRVNRQGKQLTEPEVFDALVSATGRTHMSLRDVSTELRASGWGGVDEPTLLWSALAILDLDPTRKLDKQPKETEPRLGPASGRLLAAMQRTIAFLRDDAGIPHGSVLPHQRHVLVVAAKLFALLPDLGARSRRLMVRWVWRNAVSARHAADYVFLRAACTAIVADDEDGSLQRLLALVPSDRRTWALPASRYRIDANDHKVGLLGLVALEPRDLATGHVMDVGRLLDADPPGILPIIAAPLEGDEDRHSVANRILHAPADVGTLFADITTRQEWPRILASQAIDLHAFGALTSGDARSFLERRGQLIASVVNEMVAARAEWDHEDRPSVRALFQRAV